MSSRHFELVQNFKVAKFYQAEADRVEIEKLLGSLSKTFKRILPVKGGGVPPFPLSFFEHNDYPLRGGYPPCPLRKKSAKKRLFLAKKRQF